MTFAGSGSVASSPEGVDEGVENHKDPDRECAGGGLESELPLKEAVGFNAPRPEPGKHSPNGTGVVVRLEHTNPLPLCKDDGRVDNLVELRDVERVGKVRLRERPSISDARLQPKRTRALTNSADGRRD